MKLLVESLAVLLGKKPGKPAPEEISKKAQAIHAERTGRRDPKTAAEIKADRDAHKARPKKWRHIRWAVLILVNLLFVVSYKLDVQLVEGALTASRFVGFHMADLNASLQVMLAYKQVLINLLIGIVTIFIIWWTLGGRTFCSWVCPYHLLSEWGEMLHRKLVRKKIIKNHKFDRRGRLWLWLLFAVLAFVTGYTVYETISPTGIISRALVYGPSLAVVWVLAVLLFEIFYSRRAWCRYGCPIGLTYGLVGATSPFRVEYKLKNCHHCGECQAVCMVPHVLNTTSKGRSRKLTVNIGADCTRCGSCIDVCPTKALNFKFKGK